MLEDGSESFINEAVHKVGISRSAYYKYKDHVASADDDKKGSIVVLFIIMQIDEAVFSRILRRINRDENEIVSFSRTKVSEELHSMIITFKTNEDESKIKALHSYLKNMKGIQSLTMKMGGDFK